MKVVVLRRLCWGQKDECRLGDREKRLWVVVFGGVGGGAWCRQRGGGVDGGSGGEGGAWGEWRGGSDRSGQEELFWFRRKKPAGKVFRRRRRGGGWRPAGGGLPVVGRVLVKGVCVYL
uniref:Uncharacterized protein n=1 Tax=Tanacetum cinerariifolium TaxID=118510 RepID=A0A699K345_TANCI|nr:hypothetical protein [Tanacetum cinerariifolium]